MTFSYKTILIIGATRGIGSALAEKFIANGSRAVAVGGRKENLDHLIQKHGNDKVSIFQFGITNLQGIPDSVKLVTAAHPTLDSVVLNSGIQRGFDFTKPTSVDLDVLSLEAAIHHFILALREQLSGSNVKIVEILPPGVQTELHDKRHQPDMKDGGKLGVSTGEFTEETWKGLCEGNEGVPGGIAKMHYEGWEKERQEKFKALAALVKRAGH